MDDVAALKMVNDFVSLLQEALKGVHRASSP